MKVLEWLSFFCLSLLFLISALPVPLFWPLLIPGTISCCSSELLLLDESTFVSLHNFFFLIFVSEEEEDDELLEAREARGDEDEEELDDEFLFDESEEEEMELDCKAADLPLALEPFWMDFFIIFLTCRDAIGGDYGSKDDYLDTLIGDICSLVDESFNELDPWSLSIILVFSL